MRPWVPASPLQRSFLADGPIAPFIVELMFWSCFPYAIAALLPDLRIMSERDGVMA